ncbi:hypothetical protein J6590_015130 [Homalodisca vitripennis]|nr:hypothetical protein J6590_015130 [Homalodisca vitripennis]
MERMNNEGEKDVLSWDTSEPGRVFGDTNLSQKQKQNKYNWRIGTNRDSRTQPEGGDSSIFGCTSRRCRRPRLRLVNYATTRTHAVQWVRNYLMTVVRRSLTTRRGGTPCIRNTYILQQSN